MKLLVCFSGTRPDPWIDGLRAALPGAAVSAWTPGAPPADYAVVWTPPQALLDEQPGLKAVFNIGAGVDALMALRLPPSARVVRLDDAGMSVQMAEYVCHAVIRHFREFDGYEADVRQGRWTFRKPRNRTDWPVGVMGLGVLGSRVAQALRVFEFPVNGWSRSAHAIEGVRTYAGPAQFHAFLAASRVLVNLLPLTPQTAGIAVRTFAEAFPCAIAVRATASRFGRVRSVRRTIRMASWRALVSTASPRSTGRRSEEVSRKTLALTSYLFGISRTATHPTRQMTAAAASPAQR